MKKLANQKNFISQHTAEVAKISTQNIMFLMLTTFVIWEISII